MIHPNRCHAFVVFLFSASLLTAPAVGAPVARDVWQNTVDDKEAQFLVLLKERADVAGAKRERDPNQQARSVVSALRQTAQASQRAVLARLAAAGAPHKSFWIANAIRVRGGRRLLNELALRDDVQVIESDSPFKVPIERAAGDYAPVRRDGVEWGVAAIHAPEVWALGYTGEGITIAGADTGVQWEHPALKDKYRGWNGTTAVHDYNWWDAVHSDIDGTPNPCGVSTIAPCDDDHHGTHTLGTAVGGEGSNQIGVAPGAKWIACRNMDSGMGRSSTYIECLQFFAAPTDLQGLNADPNRRAHVVNNSYGCPSSESCALDALHQAVENMRAEGIFMAVSAGNEGPDCSTVLDPPGLEEHGWSVAAVDSAMSIANFSSRGPVTVDGSGRRKPDITAPGVAVRSSSSNGAYLTSSGTSMASPHLAGAVALLWSAFPEPVRDIPGTEDLLAASAVPMTTAQGCGGDAANAVPNNVFGWGMLDVLAAVVLHGQPPTPTPTPTPTATATPTPTAPANETPEVRALRSAGRAGRAVTLRYALSDDGGVSGERVSVHRKRRTIRLVTIPVSPIPEGGIRRVRLRSRSRDVGRLRFCVTARDAEGLESAESCAPLRLSASSPH